MEDLLRCFYKETASLDDREQWPESFAWMLSWTEKFKTVFADRVKAVELPDPAQSENDAAAEPASAVTSPVSPASPA